MIAVSIKISINFLNALSSSVQALYTGLWHSCTLKRPEKWFGRLRWSLKPRKFCFCVTAAARPRPLCLPWTTKAAVVSQQVLNFRINKANLRDLIAATGLVILLKFDPNHRFFSQCDLEIWCMTSKNIRAPLLYYIKLCVSFQIHPWIQTEVTLRKRSIRVKIGDFFVPCDLEIWWMTLENNRAPLLYHTKLCASFQIHRWIQIGVTVRKRSILVKIGIFSRVTFSNLTDDLEKQ